jgi:hypothetical protein
VKTQSETTILLAMSEPLLSEEEVALARRRRLEGMALQEIEGNPLTPDEIAMFEMFERERWSHDRRRAFILAKVHKLAAE